MATFAFTANQKCEAAQAAMERQITTAVEARGWTLRRAHPHDPKKKHGFIDSQKYGMEVFRGIPPTEAADRRGGGVAIQPSYFAWAPHASGTDPDAGQLERHMAGFGWHVESQWFADQGGRGL